MGKLPPEMRYIQNLVTVGITLTYSDYQTLPAIVWNDFLLWREAEIDRNRRSETG